MQLKFTLLPGGLRQPGRSKPPPERPAFFPKNIGIINIAPQEALRATEEFLRGPLCHLWCTSRVFQVWWRVEQTLHGFLRKHCSEFCTEVSAFCTFIPFEKQYGAFDPP